MGSGGRSGSGLAGKLGRRGWRPATKLNGVSPVELFGVKCNIANAGTMWLLQ